MQNFINNIGATPYWAINNAYGGAGKVVYKSAIIDTNSQGKNLTQTTTYNIITNAQCSFQRPVPL
jgi:hypothetical protein